MKYFSVGYLLLNHLVQVICAVSVCGAFVQWDSRAVTSGHCATLLGCVDLELILYVDCSLIVQVCVCVACVLSNVPETFVLRETVKADPE